MYINQIFAKIRTVKSYRQSKVIQMQNKSTKRDAATNEVLADTADLKAEPRVTTRSNKQVIALQKQVDDLKKERNKLRAEIEVISTKANKLEEANKEVANRLDLAINSIKSVIGAT